MIRYLKLLLQSIWNISKYPRGSWMGCYKASSRLTLVLLVTRTVRSGRGKKLLHLILTCITMAARYFSRRMSQRLLINFLLWRFRFLQSSSFTISMVLQLCLKIMLINRLKLKVILMTLCSCNLMIKMSTENSLSNNSELFYFEREYNQIQVLIQD